MTYWDSRGRFAVRPEMVPDETETARPKLTYEHLASLAVTPPHDAYDNTTGAYANSPLSPLVGLHIHTPDDGWHESEPERPVHFVVERSKIAVIYPGKVTGQVTDPGFFTSPYYSLDKKMWGRYLLADNPS